MNASRISADARRGKGKSRPRIGPNRQYVHRIIAEAHFGPLAFDEVVHHINDPNDHDPSNLAKMTRPEHYWVHYHDILRGRQRRKVVLAVAKALALTA